MEKIFFPSKSSFAVFVWLTISVVSVLSLGSTDTFLNTITTTVDYSLTRLLRIQTTLLPQVTDTAATMMQNITGIRIAEAHDAEPVADSSFPPVEVDDPPKVIPKDDMQCMAENIYYEAGSQSYAGKIAVGQVVLNRVKSPQYPRTICGVIYDGSQNSQTTACQFSWLCGPRVPIAKASDNWTQSLKAAKELLSRNMSVDIVDGATSFHAKSITPAWTKKLRFVVRIDDHLFYALR